MPRRNRSEASSREAKSPVISAAGEPTATAKLAGNALPMDTTRKLFASPLMSSTFEIVEIVVFMACSLREADQWPEPLGGIVGCGVMVDG